MPPRTSLTSSFSVTDASNEVVCPLRNQDGSSCRKRCFGEKRYRSMQEHIRRAHPDHYIPKLPATEESFMMMVNTPLDQRPQTQHSQQSLTGGNATNQFGHTGFDHNAAANHYYMSATSPTANRSMPDFRRPSFIPAANAAAALTQLHNSRPPEADWDADGVRFDSSYPWKIEDVDTNAKEPFPDPENTHNYFANDTQNIFSDGQPNLDHMAALSNALGPGRPNNSFVSMQRARLNRPRKSSIAEDARKPKHERERSKDQKRISADLNKRFSSETSKRWEDLLDAAASATEEDSRDLTPIPQSPHTGSVPPFHNQNHNQFQSYNTSPLQNAVLPQSPEADNTYRPPQLEAFPSVEDSQFNDTNAQAQAYHQHQSSNESADPHGYGFARHQPHPSGSNFHMPPEGLSSSPNDASVLAHSHLRNYSGQSFPTAGPTQQPAQQPVQHYCAACHRIASLSASYACTECICGICRDCVQVLTSMNPERGSPNCPHCATPGAKFKPFMLDLR